MSVGVFAASRFRRMACIRRLPATTPMQGLITLGLLLNKLGMRTRASATMTATTTATTAIRMASPLTATIRTPSVPMMARTATAATTTIPAATSTTAPTAGGSAAAITATTTPSTSAACSASLSLAIQRSSPGPVQPGHRSLRACQGRNPQPTKYSPLSSSAPCSPSTKPAEDPQSNGLLSGQHHVR